MAEALANYRESGIPVSRAMPLVFVGVVAKFQAVFDITAKPFLDALGLTIADLISVNWKAEQAAAREALTQAIGRLSYAANVEALLVPSARLAGEYNIVTFPRRRRTGSSVRIDNVRRLPKSRRGT